MSRREGRGEARGKGRSSREEGLQEARGRGKEEGGRGRGGREQVACGNVIVGKAGPAVTHASTRGIGSGISKENG